MFISVFLDSISIRASSAFSVFIIKRNWKMSCKQRPVLGSCQLVSRFRRSRLSRGMQRRERGGRVFYWSIDRNDAKKFPHSLTSIDHSQSVASSAALKPRVQQTKQVSTHWGRRGQGFWIRSAWNYWMWSLVLQLTQPLLLTMSKSNNFHSAFLIISKRSVEFRFEFNRCKI